MSFVCSVRLLVVVVVVACLETVLLCVPMGPRFTDASVRESYSYSCISGFTYDGFQLFILISWQHPVHSVSSGSLLIKRSIYDANGDAVRKYDVRVCD